MHIRMLCTEPLLAQAEVHDRQKGLGMGKACDLPVWDRDEEKVILNLNSNPDGRGLDQKLAGKARGRGQSEDRSFYLYLSHAKDCLCTHQRLACCTSFLVGS